MVATAPVKEMIDGVWYIITFVEYSNGNTVKRIYNINGEMVDAINLKDIPNDK